MARRDSGNSARRPLTGLAVENSFTASSHNLLTSSKAYAPRQAERQTEKTPLITSSTAIGEAAESLVSTSVVAGGDMQTGVSWGMAAFLLVNTALGAGMLNYPYAYNQIGGVWAAALMQVALLVFITSTMFILVYCADLNRDDTYHDVLLSMCGKRAQQISALSILLTCYGINITFLVIIGDQYDRIFNSLMTPEQLEAFWFMDRKFTIFVTSSLFIWPMCYAQRLDFLRHASVLGMFAMLYVAFLTVYEHFKLDENMIDLVTSSLQAASLPQHGLSATTPAPSPNQTSVDLAQTTTTTTMTTKHVQWIEPLAIVPVLCFAYQTHEVIVPVYACMRERFIANFMKASIFGLVILFFLYNLVGAFGYLTFGERVGADIMSLYDAKDPVVVVGIVALVVKFITTYPPLMFCGRSALDGLYGEFRKMSTAEFRSNEPRRRYVITTLWFASSVAIAVFAPDISVTLQLLGSMASINVFVFPGMCLWSLTRKLRRARLALLMGELPEGCAGAISQQSAKDYHLISGSYFGAAMRAKNRAALVGARTGPCRAPNHAPTNCCNPNCANSLENTSPKQFTATFASLVEFEQNLDAPPTPNGLGANLKSIHGPLGQMNGGTGGEVIFSGSSISTPSSSSSSSQRSSSVRNGNALVNGYGSTGGATSGGSLNTTDESRLAAGMLEQENVRSQQAAIQRRQEGFERLIASGSFCCSCCCSCCCSTPQTPAQQANSLLSASTGAPNSSMGFIGKHQQQQQLTQSSYPAKRAPAGPSLSHLMGNSINDSCDDYCKYNDGEQNQQEHQHDQNNQLNQNHHRHLQSHYHNHQQQQCHHKSQQANQHHGPQRMTIGESHPRHQDQLQDTFPAAATAAGKSSVSLAAVSARHHMHIRSNQQQQQQQSLQTNSLNNYCQQSTTGSLLDKFGASIAPSTVAQIGISRCTASGLYAYAALLILFGIFIFILELVTVSGLL